MSLLLSLILFTGGVLGSLPAAEQAVLDQISNLNPQLLLPAGKPCDATWVSCVSNVTVVGLDFGGLLIQISANLNNFSPLYNLSSLNFERSGITELPSGISSLARLSFLDVSRNDLTSLPPAIFAMPSLRQLFFDRNPRLSMEIPPSIGVMKELVYLRGDSCALTGRLPRDLVNCTRLQRLELGSNMLRGTVPALPESLIQLILSNNPQIFGNIPTLPPGLALLALDNSSISGVLPQELPLNLQALYLQNTFIEGALPSFFNSRELRFCDLSSTFLAQQPPFDHACVARELRTVCPLGGACTCEFVQSKLVCIYPLQDLVTGSGSTLNGTNVVLGDVTINGISSTGDGSISADGTISLDGDLVIDLSGATEDFVIFQGATGIIGQFQSATFTSNGTCVEGATLNYQANSVSVSLAGVRGCGLSTAALGGIIAACVLAAALFMATLVVLRRRKIRQMQGEFNKAAKEFEMAELDREKERIMKESAV